MSDIKSKIAKILNVTECDDWVILDHKHPLYLVHYSENANLTNYGYLRGTVVDIENNTVVATSFGYTPTVVLDKVDFDKNGDLNMIDEQGKKISVNNKDVEFKMGYEGAIMRLYYHNGEIQMSTHKKLDASRSYWGGSRKFADIFKQVYPNYDKLFDETKKYSPYCHLFLIRDKEVLIASRENLKSPQVVYLGAKGCWDMFKCPYELDKCDLILREPDFTKCSIPNKFDLNRTNHHLSGLLSQKTNDNRLNGGEFVVMYCLNNNQLHLVRVVSSAYSWRSKIRNNNPNLKHRLFEMYDSAKLPNKQYDLLYPWLRSFTKDVLSNLVNKNVNIVASTVPPPFDRTFHQKFINACHCLLVSVPICLQQTVYNLIQNFSSVQQEVVSWLHSLHTTDFSSNKHLSDRAKKLLTLSTYRAKTKNISKITFSDQILYNIKFLIKNETGKSLYKLLKNKKLVLFHMQPNPIKQSSTNNIESSTSQTVPLAMSSKSESQDHPICNDEVCFV